MVILLEKIPVPVPSVVFILAIVGLSDVFQHTPLAVIAAPPSLEIEPPDMADVEVMAEGEVVVRVGEAANVVTVI